MQHFRYTNVVGVCIIIFFVFLSPRWGPSESRGPRFTEPLEPLVYAHHWWPVIWPKHRQFVRKQASNSVRRRPGAQKWSSEVNETVTDLESREIAARSAELH